MLIFGMGLYGLFISNTSTDVPSESDRALQGSSLFGMFALKVANHLFLKKKKEPSNCWFYIIAEGKQCTGTE